MAQNVLNVARLHELQKCVLAPKFDLVHQTVFFCERVGSGDKTNGRFACPPCSLITPGVFWEKTFLFHILCPPRRGVGESFVFHACSLTSSILKSIVGEALSFICLVCPLVT